MFQGMQHDQQPSTLPHQPVDKPRQPEARGFAVAADIQLQTHSWHKGCHRTTSKHACVQLLLALVVMHVYAGHPASSLDSAWHHSLPGISVQQIIRNALVQQPAGVFALPDGSFPHVSCTQNIPLDHYWPARPKRTNGAGDLRDNDQALRLPAPDAASIIKASYWADV
jgi:hypothetical protein